MNDRGLTEPVMVMKQLTGKHPTNITNHYVNTRLGSFAFFACLLLDDQMIRIGKHQQVECIDLRRKLKYSNQLNNRKN
ncbi:hypothetical protein BLOT_003208 [Blomia tropicalis]|nr:hypothetical protein BLOT_003208 [Blomia tropicalis]